MNVKLSTIADRIARQRREAEAKVTPEMVEAACVAHWPTWGRMRPDHERDRRAKMEQAIRAALGAASA